MTQISRPFQIGLVAVALLAAVWLIALRGHSSSSSSGSSGSSSAPAASSAQSSSAPSSSGGSSTTYKGSAPGVAGLSNAIAKAHAAVTTSKQNAKQLEEKSNQASSNGGSAASAPSSQSAQASTAAKAKSQSTTPKTTKSAGVTRTKVVVDRQKAVETALAGGNVVLVLFWDSKGADDVAVHDAVRGVARSEHKLVVEEAPAGQVAAFGSITRGIGVYGTPTLLIVGAHARTTVITGLTDPYSIQQAIADARKS